MMDSIARAHADITFVVSLRRFGVLRGSDLTGGISDRTCCGGSEASEASEVLA